ncbi:dihydrofolate reductase family protein [Ruania zhangjianzhongii]|uniref:dihydrofolate reductase family protein n=1 Tax=Ruania zhangjianzhongii TaxID=2603206 RepID=UPI0011C98608|nr:dihydrofolate reductase family protein [Ruania zhangjianzhongii]
MGAIVVQAFLTLDGVVQSSNEEDETPMEQPNWTLDYDAEHGGEEINALVRQWETRTAALLLGRITYEIWAGAWGVWDENAGGLEGELTRRYNRVPKFVASTTLTELGWKDSHLLDADVPAAARRLKDQIDGEIRVWGSTQLIRTLAENDLVDEYRLALYPLVLGRGTKLFGEGFPASTFARVETEPLSTGVVVNTFRRTGAARAGAVR